MPIVHFHYYNRQRTWYPYNFCICVHIRASIRKLLLGDVAGEDDDDDDDDAENKNRDDFFLENVEKNSDDLAVDDDADDLGGGDNDHVNGDASLPDDEMVYTYIPRADKKDSDKKVIKFKCLCFIQFWLTLYCVKR